MKMTLAGLAALGHPVPVTIHSLHNALYQVTVTLEGEEYLLWGDSGKPLRYTSLEETRRQLRYLPVTSVSLRHESAYDEMVGQPPRTHSNTLEVSLGPLRDDGD